MHKLVLVAAFAGMRVCKPAFWRKRLQKSRIYRGVGSVGPPLGGGALPGKIKEPSPEVKLVLVPLGVGSGGGVVPFLSTRISCTLFSPFTTSALILLVSRSMAIWRWPF